MRDWSTGERLPLERVERFIGGGQEEEEAGFGPRPPRAHVRRWELQAPG